VVPDLHIVATECGIVEKRDGGAAVDEIERLAAAVIAASGAGGSETRGFRKSPWNDAPERESPPPTSIAAITRGSLIRKTTVCSDTPRSARRRGGRPDDLRVWRAELTSHRGAHSPTL